MRRIRRPQLVLDLKDETACNQFHARLAAMECPEEGIQRAWKVLSEDQFGEYNIMTRSLTTPQFAHAFKAMMCQANVSPLRSDNSSHLIPVKSPLSSSIDGSNLTRSTFGSEAVRLLHSQIRR